MSNELQLPLLFHGAIFVWYSSINISGKSLPPRCIILCHHIMALHLNFLLLFDIKFFKCSGSFNSCKCGANKQILTIEPLHQVCSSILFSSIIIGTRPSFLRCFSTISRHAAILFDLNVPVTRILLLFNWGRSGRVEKQLSKNTLKFGFFGRSLNNQKPTSFAPHFSLPVVPAPS